jgi:hypothetical protein
VDVNDPFRLPGLVGGDTDANKMQSLLREIIQRKKTQREATAKATLARRSLVRRSLGASDAAKARVLLEEYWPGICAHSDNVRFELDCIVFLGFLRAAELDKAVQFSRDTLVEYTRLQSTRPSADFQRRLGALMGLLATYDLHQQPTPFLLSAEYLTRAADNVNAGILAFATKSTQKQKHGEEEAYVDVLAKQLFLVDQGLSGSLPPLPLDLWHEGVGDDTSSR